MSIQLHVLYHCSGVFVLFFLICILDTLHKLSSAEKAGIVEKNGQATPNQNTEYTCSDGRQIHFFVLTKPFHNKQIYK